MILSHGHRHRVDRRRRRILKMRRHFGLADSVAILFSSCVFQRRSRERHVLIPLHHRRISNNCNSSSGLVLSLQTFIEAYRHLMLTGPFLLHMCILPLLCSRPRPLALQLLTLQYLINSIIGSIHAIIVPLVVLHHLGSHGHKMFIGLAN